MLQHVEEIKNTMQQLQMEITHTYREAHQLAEYITSIALEKTTQSITTVFKISAPKDGRY